MNYPPCNSSFIISTAIGSSVEHSEFKVMLLPIKNMKKLIIMFAKKNNANLQFLIGHRQKIPAIILAIVTKTQPANAA